MKPSAWLYWIERYADHKPAHGVVLSQDEMSDAVPKDKIKWLPLFTWPLSSDPTWCRACGCGNDLYGYGHLKDCPEIGK